MIALIVAASLFAWFVLAPDTSHTPDPLRDKPLTAHELIGLTRPELYALLRKDGLTAFILDARGPHGTKEWPDPKADGFLPLVIVVYDMPSSHSWCDNVVDLTIYFDGRVKLARFRGEYLFRPQAA